MGIPQAPPRQPMPGAMDSHADWLAYAVSRGMPRERAVRLTRDEIRGEFVPPDAPRIDIPYVERLEQDPATLAARREATRKPWERC
jgi:hypothetical protein